MDFGQNNILLSICIPTWNRAETLNVALNLLLEQIDALDGYLVEIVISDNASTDNTWEVISFYNKKYPKIPFMLNRNIENLGFYGNFKVCRELSNGKYIWLLSDDDHLIKKDSLIKIIDVLKVGKYDSIYLDTRNGKGENEEISTKDMFVRYMCLLTLISTIIFKNNKNYDNYIYHNFNGNAFLGLLFFYSSINLKSGLSYILKDEYFNKGAAKPTGYNWFDVFINHQVDTLNYLSYLESSNKYNDKYKTSTLRYHIRRSYVKYKTQNALDTGNFVYTSLSEINKSLFRRFNTNIYFWINIFPLIILPKFVLVFLYKVFKKFKN